MGGAMGVSVLLEYLLLGPKEGGRGISERQQSCSSAQGLEAQHLQYM